MSNSWEDNLVNLGELESSNADTLCESVDRAERRVRELLDVAVARLQRIGTVRPFPKLK